MTHLPDGLFPTLPAGGCMRLRIWLISLLALTASLLLGVQSAQAQEGEGGEEPDQICETCHGASLGAFATFGNGEQRSVEVNVDAFRASMHGGLSCTQCHAGYENDPTPPHITDPAVKYASYRDFELQWLTACEGCHTQESDLAQDSVHAEAQASGNLNAAVCSDCHGYHEVAEAFPERPAISRTCGQCHTAIFNTYRESVHGEALLEQSNPDVPTCINCHGVHNIQSPTTNLFRVRSPLLCAGCHANEELMSKYGVSTQVFQTYVADFHGTTVTLFENLDPDAEVNKAVCYDCHGVHDIRRPDDPQARVVRENLVTTCRKCHPDATEEFAAAWTKHYIPNADKYPLVYFVNTFYQILIPATLGFMILFVFSDIVRRIINATRREEQPWTGGGH